MIILIYVDDLINTSDGHARIKEVKAMLTLKFKLSNLGDLKLFLGIGTIKIDVVIYLVQ